MKKLLIVSFLSLISISCLSAKQLRIQTKNIILNEKITMSPGTQGGVIHLSPAMINAPSFKKKIFHSSKLVVFPNPVWPDEPKVWAHIIIRRVLGAVGNPVMVPANATGKIVNDTDQEQVYRVVEKLECGDAKIESSNYYIIQPQSIFGLSDMVYIIVQKFSEGTYPVHATISIAGVLLAHEADENVLDIMMGRTFRSP